MNKKQGISIILSLSVLFIIRNIGLDNIPYVIQILLLVIGMVLFVLAFNKYNENRRLVPNIIICIVVILVCIVISDIIIQSKNISVFKEYGLFFIKTLDTLFFILIVLLFSELVIKLKESK